MDFNRNKQEFSTCTVWSGESPFKDFKREKMAKERGLVPPFMYWTKKSIWNYIKKRGTTVEVAVGKTVLLIPLPAYMHGNADAVKTGPLMAALGIKDDRTSKSRKGDGSCKAPIVSLVVLQGSITLHHTDNGTCHVQQGAAVHVPLTKLVSVTCEEGSCVLPVGFAEKQSLMSIGVRRLQLYQVYGASMFVKVKASGYGVTSFEVKNTVYQETFKHSLKHLRDNSQGLMQTVLLLAGKALHAGTSEWEQIGLDTSTSHEEFVANLFQQKPSLPDNMKDVLEDEPQCSIELPKEGKS